MAHITLKSRLQNVGITGTQLYITKPVTYSKISERDLIRHASQDSGVPQAMMYAAFDAIMLQIKELLLNGHSIQLGQLGSMRFSIRCKSAKKLEDVSVNNVKTRRLIFTPSPEMKNEIKGVKFTIETEEADEGK